MAGREIQNKVRGLWIKIKPFKIGQKKEVIF